VVQVYDCRKMIAQKMRKCRAPECDNVFTPYNSLQMWCSPSCGYKLSQLKLAKANNKQAKQEFKDNDKKYWTERAVKSCNRYIRERDKDNPCISCGRYHTGQYHAGHYGTSAARSELRFNELNIHKQCAPCNNHKSGNLVEYKINLNCKIGIKAVDWLESNKHVYTYTIEDLKFIVEWYDWKYKQLK